jgi:TetR/AcrR family transcriptional regulator, tetracycline repressor protein
VPSAEQRQSSDPVRGRGRGRGRRLNTQLVVDATVAMIDERGMAAVTMRGLAARLGVEAMSLYKHVENRDRLFDAVVDRIVNELSRDEGVARAPSAGWRPYLAGIARGIRRYARAHPHAFPLVATRPTEAPWINPPLRSVEWIEAFLSGLATEGFTDEQILFAYRSFNGFLLGFLLLETSAMTVHDPLPGDGSYAPAKGEGSNEPADAAQPVPGGLMPTRSRADREEIAAGGAGGPADPQSALDADRFPSIHRLAAGLAEDRFESEFETGLQTMLDQIGAQLG